MTEGGVPDRVVAFEARALGSALNLAVRLPAHVGEAPGTAAAADAWDAVVAEFDAVDRARAASCG
jgi:hypothetical protein